jgi:hypothetical protein
MLAQRQRGLKGGRGMLPGILRPVTRMRPAYPIAALRDAAWLDAARARAYLMILAALTLAGIVVSLALSHDGLDYRGHPLGTDFASFYAASTLALDGRAAAAWNLADHAAAEIALFGPGIGYYAFFYPPPYLLVCLPLALVPYPVALVAWLAATGTAYVAMTRAWLVAGGARIGLLPILAFPAVIVTIGHGQNAFLTAALLGFGALVQARRPWLAGVLFGAMVIKPQLAVLVALFVMLDGDRRTFLAAGLTAVGLCALSYLAFGAAAWQGFFETNAIARATLDDNLVGYEKMVSVFAAARRLGLDGTAAWALQGAAALGAVALMVAIRRAGQGPANAAGLVAATVLTTPFMLDYDLTLLAIPLAYLFAEALRKGFLPYERIVLFTAFVLPLVSRPLAGYVGLPIVPLVTLALLLSVLQRARAGSAEAEPGRPAEAPPQAPMAAVAAE